MKRIGKGRSIGLEADYMRYRWKDRQADLENPSNPWPLRIEASVLAIAMIAATASMVRFLF